MKMKRPFSLRRVGKEWNRENILRFLGYILAAFVINLALECLSRRSLGDGLHYMVTRPWQFFYDSLIILFTLSLSLLFRKRSFCFLLLTKIFHPGGEIAALHFDIGSIERQDMIHAGIDEMAIMRDKNKAFFLLQIGSDDFPGLGIQMVGWLID